MCAVQVINLRPTEHLINHYSYVHNNFVSYLNACTCYVHPGNICAANRQPEGGPFTCQCGRIFCRAGDRTRHKRFCMSHTEYLALPRLRFHDLIVVDDLRLEA